MYIITFQCLSIDGSVIDYYNVLYSFDKEKAERHCKQLNDLAIRYNELNVQVDILVNCKEGSNLIEKIQKLDTKFFHKYYGDHIGYSLDEIKELED